MRVAVKPVAGAKTSSRNEFLVVVGSEKIEAGEQMSGLDGTGSFDPSMPIVPANISYRVLSQGAVLFFGNAEPAAKIRQPFRFRTTW